MNPNKHQRKRLAQALESNGKPYALTEAFLTAWRFYALFLAVFVGGAAWLWNDNRLLAVFFCGIAAGVFWRDFTYARLNQRFKDISDHVTDWEKVKRLLNEPHET